MRSITRSLFAGLAVAALASGAQADVRWTLEMKPLKVGTETLNGVEGPGNYLYMMYEVKNPTEIDVKLSLSITVETDVVNRSYRAGFDPVLHKAVSRKFGITEKDDLKTFHGSRGTLAAGESVKVLATFGKVDPNVDQFQFVVEGLKDRVYVDRHQTWVQDDLRLFKYHRPGDELYRQDDPVKPMSRPRWITRKERDRLREAPKKPGT